MFLDEEKLSCQQNKDDDMVQRLNKIEFRCENASEIQTLALSDGTPVTHLYSFNTLMTEAD